MQSESVSGSPGGSARGSCARIRPFVGLLVGIVVASTAATIVRFAQQHAGSLSVAAWRLVLASAILTPLTLATRRAELRRLSRRQWRSAISSGLLLAIHFATWIPSVALTTVAASVLLVNTHPIVVALVSARMVGDRLSRRMVSALLIAICGAALVAMGHVNEGAHRLLGDMLALAGALAVAGYFLIGRQLRAELSLLCYIWPVYTTAAAGLMATLLLSGQQVMPADLEGWLWILLLAIGPQLVGHTMLNWSLRYLSAPYVTLAGLLMPIGAALIAWWALGERPSIWAAAGAGLVLTGVALATKSEHRARTEGNRAGETVDS
jgi:drug/metabolite transporter (DMT)-like permease